MNPYKGCAPSDYIKYSRRLVNLGSFMPRSFHPSVVSFSTDASDKHWVQGWNLGVQLLDKIDRICPVSTCYHKSCIIIYKGWNVPIMNQQKQSISHPTTVFGLHSQALSLPKRKSRQHWDLKPQTSSDWNLARPVQSCWDRIANSYNQSNSRLTLTVVSRASQSHEYYFRKKTLSSLVVCNGTPGNPWL